MPDHYTILTAKRDQHWFGIWKGGLLHHLAVYVDHEKLIC